MAISALLSGPIARATFISLAIRVGGIVLVALQAILTARLLGPEGYGVVAYVFALSYLLATLALLGTEPLAVREVARLVALGDGPGLAGFLRDIRHLVLISCIVGALASLVVLPRLGTQDENFADAVLFAAFLFPILAFLIQTQGILTGFGRAVVALAPFNLIRPAIVVSALVLAWALGLELTPRSFLLVAIAGGAIALVVARVALARQVDPATRVARRRDSGYVRLAAPFFAISVLVLLLGEINTLMLAWLTDAEETGLFQPIARLAPLVLLGVQAAAVRYAPRVSEFWTQGETARLAGITRTFTWTTTAFTALLAVLLIGLGDTLLGLFGEAFVANSAALWWVVGAQVFYAACGPGALLLTMTDRASAAILPQATGLVVNLAVGFVLIPGHGAYGAAVALSAGIVTVSLGLLIRVRLGLGLDPSIVSSVLGRGRGAA